MSATDILIKELANTINENQSRKPAPYDTTAEVIRIEGNTAWVHIPGGVDETPVQLTTNAKKGDIVQVRVSGGQAWITGNATNPPTDDTTAKAAQKTAAVADEHAVEAVTSAMLAQQFADTARDEASRAKDAADTANGILDQMEEAAEEADMQLLDIFQKAKDADEAASAAAEDAESAYNSASMAMSQLSIVEDIVGVLNLVSENGIYGITDDTEVKENKWYFRVADSSVVTPVGTENPHNKGWYELSNGIYSLTDDTTVTTGKNYYTITISPVNNPVASELSSYYELINIDSAIKNYVSDHMALVNGTLYIQNGSTRVALSTDPTVGLVFTNNGRQVAQYGSDAVIGDPSSFHITITSNYHGSGNPRISFYNNSSNEVAYISGDMLYITKTVVIQQMDVGDDDGQWSWKIHKVNGANNLYLKWLG